MTKRKTAAISLLILLMCSMFTTILFVNGQVNTTTEENIVQLAEQAGNQIQNLITTVYADENATSKIQNVSLYQQFEDNITLYQNAGLNQLRAAQKALVDSDYGHATDSALQALTVFRKVYSSLEIILETAGLHDNSSINNQELMDAINRELQRASALQNLIPTNATQEIINLLETTNSTLFQAKIALQDGNFAEAQTLYVKAKQSTPQIYQYLKTIGEESNAWRLSGYCEKLQQSIQEKFRFGSQNGINFTATLQSIGFQSENQFMEELEKKVQNAQSQTDIKKAIEECTTIGQMVQQMEQALNQEINRQQEPTSSGDIGGLNGSDKGAEGTTGGNSTNNSDKGNSNIGYYGTENYSKGGN
jgi:hypothetical protein